MKLMNGIDSCRMINVLMILHYTLYYGQSESHYMFLTKLTQ
jgi:hypothetical protein